MLESALKEQLKGVFAGLEANFTFIYRYHPVMKLELNWLYCWET